ncbi:hypothetical protein [Nitrosomonas cryotolerans]|nr:hypothetical protein [Nitrosomonas cryotolerans]
MSDLSIIKGAILPVNGLYALIARVADTANQGKLDCFSLIQYKK